MSDTMSSPAETPQREYTLQGGDWQEVLPAPEGAHERIVINMGPQHPSTHGVLRLVLELQGETVTLRSCTPRRWSSTSRSCPATGGCRSSTWAAARAT